MIQMQLIDALRLSQHGITAFVGAGGKTSAIFTVARELINHKPVGESKKTVLITTTTHIGAWQVDLADHFFTINSNQGFSQILAGMPAGVVLITGRESHNRLQGLSAENLRSLADFAEENQVPLLIEADGSNLCPLKAPAEHEPAIPAFTQNVIVVAGLMGLGKPLTKRWVHRPEIYSTLSGLRAGDIITEEAIVEVLASKTGGLRNIPRAARRVVILNQADNTELQSRAKAIADRLKADYHGVVIASLIKDRPQQFSESSIIPKFDGEIYAVVEQTAGIILAAGGSTRFGKPKQLLPWKNEPLIRHVVSLALSAHLSPIIVVLGSSYNEAAEAISDMPVRIVNNIEWETGLSSSVRVGLSAIPEKAGGAIFLQADQPQISHLLLQSLVEAHYQSLAPIIIPLINGQRGNPVLFDASTFTDLGSLAGDTGGRELFSRYPIKWVEWNDPNPYFDIDTPEDYARFLENYPDDIVE